MKSKLSLFLIIIFARPLGNAACGSHADRKLCNTPRQTLVEGKFGGNNYCLCLKHVKLAHTPLLRVNSALLLEPDVDSNPVFPSPGLHNITMVTGFPISGSEKATAEGYIGDDNNFYGVLNFHNRTLYADPYNKHNPKQTFGAYEKGGIHIDRTRRDQSQVVTKTAELSDFPYTIEYTMNNPRGAARARICELLILADKEFYEKDSNSSLNHAVMRMVHAVAQADIIFRNSDFDEDGIPDNIGFAIKYILVLTSKETNDRLFGDLLTEHIVDGRSYLLRFARLRRLSEVCLGVAFSGHAFLNQTLGLSFTSLGGGMGGAAGGLCDRRAFGRSFNTLAIAHATADENDRVPEKIASLTLAHEIGHSFGAHHDDNFPNDSCHGFLMNSQSTTSDSHLQFEFSPCSKRMIAVTLNSMSYCLIDEDRPYCGNGLVEEGEACDCGLPSRCHLHDPCCTPRAGGALIYGTQALHSDGCSVAPKAACHPSQGLCCTSECELADLSMEGIDCRWSESDCVRCEDPNEECPCGLSGRCMPDGKCVAVECARLGLHECVCSKNGPGGKISSEHKCGVCCQLTNHKATSDVPGDCVGAEYAAHVLGVLRKVPADWPDPKYRGPNISILLCAGNQCRSTVVRAWQVGQPCVVMNAVGVCSARGQCVSAIKTPRFNVYPVAMKQMMVSKNTASIVSVGGMVLALLFCLNITLS